MTLTKYDLFYEGRLSKIETMSEKMQEDVREIKSDIRWMMGVWISINCIMMGLMAKGFNWF
ncbi:MAG TPA: hypothetical protein VK590_08495 [Saprospiraceae bacterium]|nr:hypothetical protein [Saprospiraceae bacterium]